MRHPDRARIPMVLCNASYYGTVAARAGIPVVAVDTGLLSTGRRSRYSNSYLSSAPFESADWSDWLLTLGQDGGRRTIYATSDAVSFAIANRREELSSVFDLYQPSLEIMMCILDAEWRGVEPLIARSLQCALDEARVYFQGLGNLQDTDALTMYLAGVRRQAASRGFPQGCAGTLAVAQGT